ncbi:MAG: hypothetical protein U9R68_09885, partial [Planctomycetota bacterium]|nr:hypothetical protein [Planctomycetota bacterium]
KANKWFEESVCETASLFALRRMAEVWKTDPPYPNWRDYAPHLREYAGNRTKDARLPADTTLADWYARHADHLRKEACDRPKNEIVAGALLPLFEEKPARWAAVQYLNAAAKPEPRSFGQYLAAWHANCPAAHRPFVRRVADLFGIRLGAGAEQAPAHGGAGCHPGTGTARAVAGWRLARQCGAAARPTLACSSRG